MHFVDYKQQDKQEKGYISPEAPRMPSNSEIQKKQSRDREIAPTKYSGVTHAKIALYE